MMKAATLCKEVKKATPPWKPTKFVRQRCDGFLPEIRDKNLKASNSQLFFQATPAAAGSAPRSNNTNPTNKVTKCLGNSTFKN